MSTSLPVAEPEILEESRVRAQRLWCTVVHDDPVNTMSYVTWVFHSYFGFSLPVAEALMMQVHTTGRAVVSRGLEVRILDRLSNDQVNLSSEDPRQLILQAEEIRKSILPARLEVDKKVDVAGLGIKMIVKH